MQLHRGELAACSPRLHPTRLTSRHHWYDVLGICRFAKCPTKVSWFVGPRATLIMDGLYVSRRRCFSRQSEENPPDVLYLAQGWHRGHHYADVRRKNFHSGLWRQTCQKMIALLGRIQHICTVCELRESCIRPSPSRSAGAGCCCLLRFQSIQFGYEVALVKPNATA